MRTFLAIIGGIAIIVVLAVVLVLLTAWLGEDRVPSKVILETDFEQSRVSKGHYFFRRFSSWVRSF